MSDDESSMKGKTYLEILAENDAVARRDFDENAKDALVEQNRYEDNVEPDDKHPDELEDQQLFQQVQPSRQIVEIPKSTQYKDLTTQSVRYNKDIQTRVINIDSRFRPNPLDTSTNFLYKLPTPIKNVISVSSTSAEIPNTYYNFSSVKSNVYMTIRTPLGPAISGTNFFDIVLPDGNYIVDVGTPIDFTQTPPVPAAGFTFNPVNIIDVLNQLLFSTFSRDGSTLITNNIIFQFDPVSGKINVSDRFDVMGNPNFELIFDNTGSFLYRIEDWGLGYYLGFRKRKYLRSSLPNGISYYQAEAIIDVIGPNYLFLSLNPDWKVVQHTDSATVNLAAFTKVVVNVAKNDIIYDNGSNTITKEYWLSQPITVSSFQVHLVDLYGEDIDLIGANISLTIELKEAMNPALYDHIREV
jgi:hypothetical protein